MGLVILVSCHTCFDLLKIIMYRCVKIKGCVKIKDEKVQNYFDKQERKERKSIIKKVEGMQKQLGML